jgi:diguanylate cyclase (GGDEF)-like protein
VAVVPGLGRALTAFPIQPLLDVVVKSLSESLGFEGAGIAIVFKGTRTRFISTNDPAILELESLQSRLKGTPGERAAQSGEMVALTTLNTAGGKFAVEVLARGFASVFSFPLGDRTKDRAVGALTLYLKRKGPLSDAETRIITAVTAITSEFLVNAQQKLVEIIDVQQRGPVGEIDRLTGLPSGETHRSAVMSQSKKGNAFKESVGVVYIDLDRFKLINDTYGHEIGNQVLVAVAQRLAGLTREGQVLTREGGDEFIIFCDRTTAGEMTYLGERIKRAFEYPFVLPKSVIGMRASVGLALSPPGEWFQNELFSEADEAMYAVKRNGGGGFLFFDADQEQLEKDADTLASDLATAIRDGHLSLAFQPVCQAANGFVVGFEVLLRWHHPARGMIPAKTAIYLAEQRGLMPVIGYWIFEEAFKAFATLMDENPAAALVMSVNASPLQLMDQDFAERIQNLAQSLGMKFKDLIIEVTETTLFNDGDTARTALGWLMTQGVKVSLDDFGTGYSSLAHLREFSVSQVKIDASFIQAAPGDKVAHAVVCSIATLGKTLGISIVAEGVETEKQNRRAMEAGCELAQGYHHFRPVSLEDLSAIVKRQGQAPPLLKS